MLSKALGARIANHQELDQEEPSPGHPNKRKYVAIFLGLSAIW